MAATVLRTDQAIVATRMIVRSFVTMERLKTELVEGRNLPISIEHKSLVPLETEFRQGLMGKINDALTKVMDAMINPVAQTSVRDEAKLLVAQGLETIKDHLKTAGIQNEKASQRSERCWLRRRPSTLRRKRPRLGLVTSSWRCLPSSFRLILAAQRYAETGAAETLDAVLRELSA